MSKRQWAMSGRKGFNSKFPMAAAEAMTWSCPIARRAACVTASGITGLTLPGMMEEPVCRAGETDFPRPASGPEDISRRSEETFTKLTAWALRMPETSTNTSAFCVASVRFSARAKPMPV